MVREGPDCADPSRRSYAAQAQAGEPEAPGSQLQEGPQVQLSAHAQPVSAAGACVEQAQNFVSSCEFMVISSE